MPRAMTHFAASAPRATLLKPTAVNTILAEYFEVPRAMGERTLFPGRAHEWDYPRSKSDEIAMLAARGESPSAFDERCILASCVAPPSNTGRILGRCALPARRLARLGAAPDFHHGLLGVSRPSFRQLDCEHHSAACRDRSVTLVGAGGWWPDPQLD